MPTHPDSARLDAALVDWGKRSGLFDNATDAELAEIRMGHVAYYAAPLTSSPVLWLIGTFGMWLFGVDDYIVEPGLPLSDLKRACDDVIRGGQTSRPLAPGSRYFLELRREMIALGGGELLPQLADAVQHLFLANEKEQRYIKDDILPGLADYLRLRTGIVSIQVFVQVQRCERGLLPPHRYLCDRLQWLSDLSSLLSGLLNDIIGFRRDIETNFPMNIIAVLALEFRVDLATAYVMSINLIEAIKHSFDALVEDVCAHPGPYPEAAAQARAISVWPDAWYTWHQTTPRYLHDQAVAPPEVAVPDYQDWRSGPLLRALASRGNRDAPTQSTAELFGWLPMSNRATGSTAVRADSAAPAVPAVPVKLVPNPATPPNFPSSIPVRWEPYRNWARTVTVDGVWVCEPRDTAEVVSLVNWARVQGFRIRASAGRHNFTPLTVTDGADANRVLLVDTRKHLTGLRMVSRDPAAVQVGTGGTIEALLTFLENQGYGLATAPVTGDLTLGGLLATGAHGNSVDVPGQVSPLGHNHGLFSNLVISFTAIVWDETRGQYVARTFDRSHPDSAAFLVHLGRAFLTEVTLRVGSNQILRCVSDVNLLATEIFGPASVPSAQRFASMVQRAGRVDVLWFPYHDRTWVKTWTSASGPSGARPTMTPYNYPFTDNVPAPISDLVTRVMNGAPELAPMLSAQQHENIVRGLAATVSADLIGPSKNVLLWERTSILRHTTNGYAICTRRADLQRVVHEFAEFYRRRLHDYQQQGRYPINGGLHVRATSMDSAAGLELPDARPPALSSIAPYSGRSDWDVAVWLGVFTLPGTPYANPFYREIEEFLFTHYRPPYAMARPEWSKGWAFTDDGPCSDQSVLTDTIPRTFGDSWSWAKSRLMAYDPHRVFSNDFLDSFL
ncbi:cholesterol oxidase substrate-binding domain-containing protein [Nannocystis sp. ncelm1]|uniref:Cholesterol oxidase substrate-binding domain-containing protein n=2 Tax=Nannocystis radixulma TaxID=2995305 RepID=A0ABT5BEF0_9BACT|nr:cholesterol oxidase substrate-binding domain-containing protein [Nannocystis radixulma]